MSKVQGFTGAVTHAIETVLKAKIRVVDYTVSLTALTADIVVKREDAMKVIEAALPIARSINIQEESDEVRGLNGKVRRVSRGTVHMSVWFYHGMLPIGEPTNE